MKKRILIITQYFHPATVITAKLYLGLAQELVNNGFDVTVLASNRYHVTENEIKELEEEKDGIHIIRFDIPKVKIKFISRFIQSFFLQKGIRKYLKKTNAQFDVAIIASHPVFSYFLFPFLKRIQNNIKIYYWCFDLFPDGIIDLGGIIGKLFLLMHPLVVRSLSEADVAVDLGLCMRKRIQAYTSIRNETLTPWALVEEKTLRPIVQEEKEKIFGKHKFFFLFSGSITYGRNLDVFIGFIRYCREQGLDIALCIAGFGHFAEKLKKEYRDCTDYIVFMDYCDETELRKRLSAADVHLLSLEDQATGCAVPSKFFASLAVGRPVVAAVSRESCIAHWIEQYQIGTVLHENDYESSFQFIKNLYCDKEYALKVQSNALNAYKQNFSREVVTSRWIQLINGQ